MTATGDGEGVTIEQVTVVAEVPATEQPQQPEKKPAKEKKTKAVPKEKKPKEAKTASHPPYFQMIKDALLALNGRSGSSPYAIAKYMEEKHKGVLPANFRKILALQLKNSEGRGKLIKIKASYKLSEAAKKEKAVAKTDAAKKAKATTVAVIKVKAVKKPETTKKAVKPAKKKAGAKKVKKTTAAAAKLKQPRSIRSPAAKRAKKTTA